MRKTLPIIKNALIMIGCTIAVTACSGGNVNSVPASGVLFGNNAGLVYYNNNLLSGKSQTYTVDSAQIIGISNINGTLYAVSSSGKVYQYNNQQWVQIPGNGAGGTLDGQAIYGGANTASVIHNGQLYVGTSNGNVFTLQNNYWNRIGGNVNATVQSIAFDDNNNLYIGTGNGYVFKYANGVWNALDANQIDNGAQVNSITFYNGTIYVGTSDDNNNGYIYEYSNSAWSQVSAPLTTAATSVNTLATFNGNLYAGTTTGDNTGDVEKYDGSTWTSVTSPDGTPVNVLVTQSNTLYAATAGNPNGQVFTYGGGTTWNQVSSLNSGSPSTLTVTGNDYYVGVQNPIENSNQNTEGIFHYNSSMPNWQPVAGQSSVDSSSIILSTAIDKSGNFYVGTIYNVYKYNKNDKSWTPIATNTYNDYGGISSISIGNDNTVYFTTFSANVYYANGAEWQQIGSQLPGADTALYSATDSNNNLFIAVNNASYDVNYGLVYKCNKTNCQLMSGPNENGSLDNSTIQSIATDNLGNVYVGSFIGLVWEYPVGDTTWQVLGAGTPDYGQVSSITFNNKNEITIGTSGSHVYKYNGLGWTQLGFGIIDNGSPINTVTYDSNNVLHVLTAGGNMWEYISNNNGWINQKYGNGIITGSTPTASAN